MSETTEVHREQQHLDVLYSRFDEVRADTDNALAKVRRATVGGHHQNRSERDAYATMYEDQLHRLNSAENGLCFGRLDVQDSSQPIYIGRIGLADESRRQILLDWRAPAAEAFYRATPTQPDGVVRRRHIATRGRTVTGVEDDVLDLDRLGAGERAELNGEGALIAALDAHRTGRMSDIVSTIQAEQDHIIRDDLAGVLVVQGGPGTGKTAVALHRAAYLLYRYRARIAKSGVLLIGPSPVFLKYIEQVLPSLGETGAVMLTPGQLLPGVDTTVHDEPDVAAIKGQLVMADVIAAHIAGLQRVPQQPEELPVGRHRILLTPETVHAARAKARLTNEPHNVARVTFVAEVLRDLARQLATQMDVEPTPARLRELSDELRGTHEVKVAINLCWLPQEPAQALESLLTKPHKLAAAGRDLLSAREQTMLLRHREAAITVADVPLLDELAERLGPVSSTRTAGDTQLQDYAAAVVDMTGTSDWVTADALASRWAQTEDPGTVAERAAHDREWAYGHVVVDEAQELSPMQWRSVFRRVPSKSATIVGDLAQASTTDPDRSWQRVLAPHIGDRFRLAQLTVSYRTPGKIMDVANAMLAHYFPTLSLPAAVRAGDAPPRVIIADSTAEVVAALPHEVTELRRATSGGRTAVICVPWLTERVEWALAGMSVGTGSAGIDREIAILDPHQVKGLEFDGVIIVEPGAIAPGEDLSGVGELYVALTRATSRLTVIGSRPSALQPALSQAQS